MFQQDKDTYREVIEFNGSDAVSDLMLYAKRVSSRFTVDRSMIVRVSNAYADSRSKGFKVADVELGLEQSEILSATLNTVFNIVESLNYYLFDGESDSILDLVAEIGVFLGLYSGVILQSSRIDMEVISSLDLIRKVLERDILKNRIVSKIAIELLVVYCFRFMAAIAIAAGDERDSNKQCW